MIIGGGFFGGGWIDFGGQFLQRLQIHDQTVGGGIALVVVARHNAGSQHIEGDVFRLTRGAAACAARAATAARAACAAATAAVHVHAVLVALIIGAGGQTNLRGERVEERIFVLIFLALAGGLVKRA